MFSVYLLTFTKTEVRSTGNVVSKFIMGTDDTPLNSIVESIFDYNESLSRMTPVKLSMGFYNAMFGDKTMTLKKEQTLTSEN